MLDVIVSAAPAARRESRTLAVVFSTTLFLSAFLMFLVEPMIARMVLPTLGGAASVWNTCLVFFQAVLLCGYAYAHLATTRLGARRQVMVHVALVAAPLLLLPVALPAGGAPPTGNPAGWLLLTLLASVGLPFFALSTSAGVLQKWYSATDAVDARDPYFLYAASNMGSFAGLLAYPLFFERTFRLQQQAQIWTAGYALLAFLTLVCAVSVRRQQRVSEDGEARPESRARRVNGASPVDETPRVHEAPWVGGAPVAEAVSWTRRARWVLLAFVPSSLLLAVTSHMSTEIASVPLLWMVPLGIYLATFVVAFSPSASAPRALASRLMPLGIIVLTMVLIGQMNQPVTLILPLHLIVFAVIALSCHGDLANDRPGPTRLTEFFFWISLGGMLGGLFNALVAPVVFTGIVEYPLVLVLACFIRRPAAAAPRATWPRDLAWIGAIAAAATVSALVNSHFGSSSRFVILGAAVPALITFAQQKRALRFAACVAALMLSGALVESPFGRGVYAARTFFGVYRIRLDDRLHYRFMFHGPTLHGLQSTLPERRHESLSYYHPTGPIGQVLASVPLASTTSDIAVVGLGVGSLATYARPGQHWAFYEIDPAVERFARDTRLFTYLDDCGRLCSVTIGDARISLTRARPQQFGLIILDAFSSDAIPMHLLTREALSLYLSRLAPGGTIAIHISNHHLGLAPVVGRLAAATGMTARVQRDTPTDSSLMAGKFPSEWVVLARTPADLGPLASDARWLTPAVPAGTPLWTDDFSNILSVLR